MKRKVVIILEDLNDLRSTLYGLKNLFKQILTHYITEKNDHSLTSFILYCSIYFGQLLREIGYEEELNED